MYREKLMNQYYKIITPNNSHYAVVKPSKTGKLEIVLGGKDYICVTISAPNNDLNIKTDPVCYLGEQFPNQPADAKEMLRASILLAKHIFGDCNIELTDLSDKDGMSLSSLMLVFHQQTWYEKWFGARIIDDSKQEIYKENIQRFCNPKIKEASKYFEQRLKKSNLESSDIKDILSIYDATTTYKQFFNKLRETFHPPVIYNLIKPWLNAFIEELGLGMVRTEPWIISCSNHDFADYSIENLQHDPYNGNYIFITRKQKGGGGHNKKLSKAEKYSLQMPNWIGWLHMKEDEYDTEDQEYIKMLRLANKEA